MNINMTATLSATTTSMPGSDISPEEHAILYNISSIFSTNSSSHDSSDRDNLLDWNSLFFGNASLNFTFEEVTFLASFGKSPVRSKMQPSILNIINTNLKASVMPVALTVGIVGNLLLVFTFMFTPLCASALSHYLTALGVSDFIYLMSSLAVWITNRGINFQNTMGVCQITMFSLMLFGFLNTWYLSIAHAERIVVHFGSVRARKWCTTFRTKCIIIAIFVFSLVGYSHHIWIHIVIEWKGSKWCLIMPESRKHMMELGKIEVIFALFLPMILIVAADIALFASVAVTASKQFFKSNKPLKAKDCEWRGEYALANETMSRSPSTRSGDSNPPPPEFDISRERTRATLLVVIAGLIFLGTVLPSSIFRTKQYFNSLARPSAVDWEFMSLTEEMAKFNSVYKIFFYPIMLKGFRRGLIHFLRHGFCQRRVELPLQETSV